MCFNATGKAMPLNNACKTATFGLSGHVNEIALIKLLDGQLLANLIAPSLLGTKFTQVSQGTTIIA